MSAAFQLCYVTERLSLKAQPLPTRILEAIRAGVNLVQIREPDLTTRELMKLVGTAVEAARGTGSRIVVNDRLDVALACGASGVHLGSRSMPPAAVRARVPKDFLLGGSCHSLEEALAAQSGGADYLLLGPIFATPSKLPYGPPLGLEKLREVTAKVKIPVLALGGITVQSVKACLEAGATGIAGIRIFQDCDSLQARVKELRGQFPS